MSDSGLPEEEWERRLRGAPSPLPPPPGAFGRVRRTARRRRRVRAAGAGAAAALAAGLVAVPVALGAGGFDTVNVRPPAAGAAGSSRSAPPPQRATESSQVVPSGPAEDQPGPGRTPSARPSTPGPVRSTTAAPLPACGTERLKGTMTDPVPGEAYGSRTAELVLTNVSPGSCVLTGVPELALLDGERAPIETETAPPATPESGRLVVTPGGTVRAALSWTTAREPDELLGCYPVPAWLRVRPPGGLTWLETGWRGQEVCRHGRVEVGPLRSEA